MSGRRESTERFVVGVRLLGEELSLKKRRNKEKEYAIEVVLSDESRYTVYRMIKEIAIFQARLISRFPVEAGYFGKTERVLPTCPVKQTIFGPSRIVNDDRIFEKLLNSYLKELPSLPASVVKSDLLQAFFALRATDISLPGESDAAPPKKKQGIVLTDESEITGPVRCKSYYAVATFSDSKSKFSFTEGATVQVITKDPTGWWLVEVNGKNGWAPAAFLVPMEEDALDDAQEITQTEKVGARYISMSSYQASRDDELSFVKGAVVSVITQYVDGWWLVRHNGGEGFVPGSLFRKFDRRQGTAYVKGIKRKFINRQSTRIIPTVKPNWLHGAVQMTRKRSARGVGKVPLYQVVEDFKGTEEDKGFTLSKDAVVKVLDKKDHGWWYVEDQHGRRGWAPATFLKLSTGKGAGGGSTRTVVGTPHTVVQSHTAEREDELTVDHGTTVTVIWAADDGWWMVRNESTQDQGLLPSVCLKQTNEDGGVTPELAEELSDPEEDEEEITIHFSDDFDAADGDVALDDCCVATVDYAAASVDELDLYEGQVVCVIDDSDTEYWYVNVDGKEGWVPSSVLNMLSDKSTDQSWEPSESVSSSRDFSADISEQSDSEGTNEGGSDTSPPIPVPRILRRSSPVIGRRHISPGRTGLGRTLSSEPPTRVERLDRRVRSVSEGRPDDEGEVNGKTSDVTILIDNKSFDELEKEALEAERIALEAQKRAQALRKVMRRKSASSDN